MIAVWQVVTHQIVYPGYQITVDNKIKKILKKKDEEDIILHLSHNILKFYYLSVIHI